MMERLTNSDKEIPTLVNNAEYWLQVYFKLKDIEDLDEQGLLLRLLCKVGDTVYYRTNNNDIYPIKINEINISNSDVIYNGYFMKCTYEFDNSNFGKTVFLTQAEAEQKLK